MLPYERLDVYWLADEYVAFIDYLLPGIKGLAPNDANQLDRAAGPIPYNITDDQLMTCEWFNYQEIVAIAGSEIRLQKWVCPDDFDAEAAGTIDELWAGCTTPGADFPFSRVPDGGDPPVELTADAGGAITWPEFPPGTGFVAETAAELSLSRVFCTSYDVGAVGIALYN